MKLDVAEIRNEPQLAGVYVIRSPRGEYIGSSIRIAIRLKTHVWALRNGRHVNQALQRDWNELGAEAFTFEVLRLKPAATEAELVELEARIILKRRPLYNVIRDPREPPSKRGHSPETRAKISASNKGKHSGSRDPHSEESKRRMSEARRGKDSGPRSEGRLAKQRAGSKAYWNTPAGREVARKRALKRWHPELYA